MEIRTVPQRTSARSSGGAPLRVRGRAVTPIVLDTTTRSARHCSRPAPRSLRQGGVRTDIGPLAQDQLEPKIFLHFHMARPTDHSTSGGFGSAAGGDLFVTARRDDRDRRRARGVADLLRETVQGDGNRGPSDRGRHRDPPAHRKAIEGHELGATSPSSRAICWRPKGR